MWDRGEGCIMRENLIGWVCDVGPGARGGVEVCAVRAVVQHAEVLVRRRGHPLLCCGGRVGMRGCTQRAREGLWVWMRMCAQIWTISVGTGEGVYVSECKSFLRP